MVDQDQDAGGPRDTWAGQGCDPVVFQAQRFCYDEPEQIQGAFEELTGKPVDGSLSLIPPFYADYGLNITVGRKVHIGYECMFTGRAPIEIADEVMIANKTNLVTSGHPVPPDQRRDHLTGAPIIIEANVWIGTAATIPPPVRREAGRSTPERPAVSDFVRVNVLGQGGEANNLSSVEPLARRGACLVTDDVSFAARRKRGDRGAPKP